MASSTLKKDNRDILFTTRMTTAEAARVDETLAELNKNKPANAPRVTRSLITRMGIEMMLAQASA